MRGSDLLRACIVSLCVTFVLLWLMLLLAGCATHSTKVRWNPLTWGTDRAEAVAKVEQKIEVNERALIRSAQVEVVKTVAALSGADSSAPVLVARRMATNTESLLATANGPVPMGETIDARAIVEGLLSAEIDARSKAERLQMDAEDRSADLADDNAELQTLVERQTDKLEAGYLRERKLANTVRNFWFVAGGLAILFVAGNVLSLLARLNPAFSGVAAVANGVISPAMSYAYSRAQTGLTKVGEGMNAIREKVVPAVASEVQRLMDESLDDDHKKVASRHAKLTRI